MRDQSTQWLMFGTVVSIKPGKAAILYAIVQLIAIGLVVAAIVSSPLGQSAVVAWRSSLPSFSRLMERDTLALWQT